MSQTYQTENTRLGEWKSQSTKRTSETSGSLEKSKLIQFAYHVVESAGIAPERGTHDWCKADTLTMIISNHLFKSESAFVFLTYFLYHHLIDVFIYQRSHWNVRCRFCKLLVQTVLKSPLKTPFATHYPHRKRAIFPRQLLLFSLGIIPEVLKPTRLVFLWCLVSKRTGHCFLFVRTRGV